MSLGPLQSSAKVCVAFRPKSAGESASARRRKAATRLSFATRRRPMIYELRIYRTLPGRLPNLLARFQNHTLRIWERHGIRQAGFWTTLAGESNYDLTYLLAWESLAEREVKWPAIRRRSGMARSARRIGEGRPDRRQHQQPVVDPDGFLLGQIAAPRCTK